MNTNEHKYFSGWRLGVGAAILGVILLVATAQGQVTRPAPRITYASVDCSKTGVLKDIAGDKILRDRLLRQMAASSLWRVIRERGMTVAVRQESPDKSDVIKEKGTENFGVETRVFLAGYRMTVGPEEMALVRAGSGEAKVPVIPSNDKFMSGSNSIIAMYAGDGEATMAIEIREFGKGDDLKRTRDELTAVVRELEVFKKGSDEVEKNGFVEAITPAGSVVEMEGPGTLKVEDGFQKGIYDVSGYVNPGEAGYITIDVVYNKTGELIDHELTSIRTLQYVGWSKDPGWKFRFSSEVLVGAVPGTDGKNLDVTFRVVFHPLETRVLLEKPQKASTWER